MAERDRVEASSRQELVQHLRENRETLRQQWVAQMEALGLLEGLSSEQVTTQSAAIYETWVEAAESGRYDGAAAYAATAAERSVLRGVTAERVLSGYLLLRDVCAKSLVLRHQHDMERLFALLEVYWAVANKILVLVATAFVNERERIVREQQEALRELSTPVLRVRDRLLILPIIGVLDTQRARQLTEQMLHAIRDTRAKVVIMDITGVATVDSKVANHLVQTVDAAQLLGAKVIVTGIAPEIAQTLVAIGVDLSRLRTICDLQGGLEEADRLLAVGGRAS